MFWRKKFTDFIFEIDLYTKKNKKHLFDKHNFNWDGSYTIFLIF